MNNGPKCGATLAMKSSSTASRRLYGMSNKAKMLPVILASALISIVQPNLSHAETGGSQTYLCVTEMSVGFKYNQDSKAWEHAKFIANNKYLLRRPNANDPQWRSEYQWLWFEFGQKIPQINCSFDFGKVTENFEVLDCGTHTNKLTFNRSSMRFSKVYDGQLLFSTGPGDTPTYEVGSCSTL